MTDIEGLLAGVSPEELENLKGIAQSILAGNTQESEKKDSATPLLNDSLLPIMSAIGKMNENDERISLILHLKPLLGEGRQKKADEAISFLRLMQILPEIRGLLNERN